MSKNKVSQNEELKTQSNISLIKRLFTYLRPFKIKVVIILILLTFVMICGILNPYLLKIAIDNNIKNNDVKGLLIIGGFMAGINFLAMIASRLRINLMASVTNKILLNIRHELYTHIQKLSFSFFDNRPVGKVLARVIGDVNSLQELFSNSITNFIPEILTLVCTGIMMFYLNYKLAIASILILPFLAASMFGIEVLGRKRWQVYRQKRSIFNAFTHEDFSGIRVIQSFAVEDKTSKTFNKLVKEMMDAFIRAVKLGDFFWPLVEISWGIGSVVVFWYSPRLIKSGELTVGTLIAFTWYISMFWRPIMNISNFYNTLITNFAAAERLFEIMDIKPDIVDAKNAANAGTNP